MLVTVPCLLLLLDVWPLRRGKLAGIAAEKGGRAAMHPPLPWSRLVLEKLPLLVLAAVVSRIAVASQGGAGAIVSTEQLTLPLRMAAALVACVAYLWSVVWPLSLAPFYPHPVTISTDLAADLFLPAAVALLLLAAFTTVALRQWKRRTWLAVGWFWYLGMLVPVIGIVQIGTQARADRYTYLPLIGVAVALVWSVGEWMARRPETRRVVIAAAATLGLAWLALTWLQVAHWRADIPLFEHAIRVTQGNYFAHNQLGAAWKARNDLPRAEEQYAKALRIFPGYAFAHNNLGVCYAERGAYELAHASFQRAAEMDKKLAKPHRNLAELYSLLGRNAEAEPEYERALALDPSDAKTTRFFAYFCAKRGRLAEAAEWFERSLQLDPYNADAWYNLGIICARKGDVAKGITHLEQALRIAPQHVGAREGLVVLRSQASGTFTR